MAHKQLEDPHGSTSCLMVRCNYSKAARKDSMNVHKESLLFLENYRHVIHGDLMSNDFFYGLTCIKDCYNIKK